MTLKKQIILGRYQISTVTVLRTLDTAVRNLVSDVVRPSCLFRVREDIPSTDPPILSQPVQGIDWLKIIGKLAYQIPTNHIGSGEPPFKKWLPCCLKIGREDGARKIGISKVKTQGGEEGERVDFPNARGSYEEIVADLSWIKESIPEEPERSRDCQISEFLLRRLVGEGYPEFLSLEQKHFFDALLVLLFGVEVSRNNATLLTALMLLDLIRHNVKWGRYGRVFDWKNAFLSIGVGIYEWEDEEHLNIGGKFPMATNSTGNGNLGITKGRQFLLYQCKFSASFLCDDEIFAIIQNNLQSQCVLYRELSICFHWLSNLTSEYKQWLEQSILEENLISNIKELFVKRLKVAFAIDPSVDPLSQFLTNTDKEKTYPPLPRVMPQDQKLKLDLGATCVIYNNLLSRYYHNNVASCKLLPNNTSRQEWGAFAVPIEEAKRQGKQRCPYCYNNRPQL